MLCLEASVFGGHEGSEGLLWGHCYGALLELPLQPFCVFSLPENNVGSW